MPRTRSIVWAQLKLGIIGVVAVVVVIGVIFAVGGEGGFPWQRYPLKARFTQVNGLKNGAVIRLNGKEVGQVKTVEFAGAEIDVVLQLSRDVRHLVTTDSVATVGSLSLLGEPIIDVTAATTGTPLPDWAYLKSTVAPGGLSGVTTTAQQGIERINQLVADVQSGRGTLGKLLTDEAVYQELEQFTRSAARVSRALEAGEGTIGGLLKDPAAYNSLKASLENFQAVTERMKTGSGPLARLLNDEAMAKSLSGTVTNLEGVTAGVRRGEGTLGKLFTDQQLFDRLNSVSERVDRMLSGLNAGEGTAGRLLHDRQLYENMNTAVAEMRGLLADIRKDPKKFLRVSVSIF